MTAAEDVLELATPHGPARAHLSVATEPRLALVLGHGAGGGVQAPDLRAASEAALEAAGGAPPRGQPFRPARPPLAPPAQPLVAAASDLGPAPGRGAPPRVPCVTPG